MRNHNSCRWFYTLSDQLVESGRRRFAIGHELGHWQMHGDTTQLFYCTPEDLRDYRNSRHELEANTFASELLMPKFMIDENLLSGEPIWEAIQAIAKEFSVMPMAAAVRYADLTKQPVMVVFSNAGRVWWWRENRPKAEDLWLESKQELSDESVVFYQARGENEDHSLTEVPWHAWFPHIRADEDEELFEMAGRIDDRGTFMSVLWIPSRI